MIKPFEHWCMMSGQRLRLCNKIKKLKLQKSVPKEYWETESDDDVQASILKGIIEQK